MRDNTEAISNAVPYMGKKDEGWKLGLDYEELNAEEKLKKDDKDSPSSDGRA